MGRNRRPYAKKLEYVARRRGLFAMGSGTGPAFKYDFWDRKTGKLVVSWYPASGHWLAGQREGRESDFRDALDAAGFPAPPPTHDRTGRRIRPDPA